MSKITTLKPISRRQALFGTAALTILGTAARSAEARYQITLYRDPNCACCMDWVAIARKTFEVEVVPTASINDVKKKLEIPSDLMSCHTGVVDKYVIEGHVPPEDIARLLREKPFGVRGLAVPGMPIGSPGMEAPDGRVDPYAVLAFRTNGELRVWARYGGA